MKQALWLVVLSLGVVGCSTNAGDGNQDPSPSVIDQLDVAETPAESIVAGELDVAETLAPPIVAAIGSCSQMAYDADLQTVASFIHANCGGVTSCPVNSSTHVDLLIGGSYCSCYALLFARRSMTSFNNVQVIYHERAACTTPHIHIQKHSNLCGKIQYDVDEGLDGGGADCVDNEISSVVAHPEWVDRWSGAGKCPALQHDARFGTCNNP